MRQVFEEIQFITGDADILSKISEQTAFRVFDRQVREFLSALSGKLLSLSAAKAYPDVITFAFWCRKANLSKLSESFFSESKQGENRLGRGAAFHIAPSNVPVNFAYTLAAGMLAGNANIVRLPSKEFPQTNLICASINAALAAFPSIAERLCLIRYEHNKAVTDAISLMCSSRIIWGGDSTVDEIRKSPIPSRANELTFPDRYSICLINADRYVAGYDSAKTAKDFFNDTYLTDQNACTSPRLVIWTGNERRKAKAAFWGALEEIVETGYELQAVQTVNKLTAFYEFAAGNPCNLIPTGNYKLTRVQISEISPDLPDYFGNSGYFYEYDVNSLDEILPLCGRKCQTLSYIGFDADELRRFILDNSPFGVDRIVPVGKTMEFSLTWDGIDIVRMLSREVCITVR
jgi:hypothetical protein